MKRILLRSMFALGISSLAVGANAQSTYWTEYFDDANAGALTGTTASAPTTPTSYNLSTGSWTFYFSVRAGSGCTPTDPVSTVSAKAVRVLKSNSTSPAGIVPPAYMTTPALSFGVGTVTWKNAKSTTGTNGITIAKSTDGGTTWVPVLPNPILTTAVACDTYTATVNDPAANKIRIENNSTSDQDIDNVTITSTSTIVPVKFTSLSALQTTGQVKVSWGVATEVNTAKYVVEKSTNGSSFAEAGTLTATQSSSYTWFDMSPSSKVNYYRVKSVDKDGHVIYTAIVKVSGIHAAGDFLVTPNPVKGNTVNLQLQGLAKGSYSVIVFNGGGQQVFAKSLTHDGGSATYQLQLPGTVKAGIYNLQLKDGENVINKKIVVE